jgi:hypothetical protein
VKEKTRKAVEAFRTVCMLEALLKQANADLQTAAADAAREDEAEYVEETTAIQEAYERSSEVRLPRPREARRPLEVTISGHGPDCRQSHPSERFRPCIRPVGTTGTMRTARE